MSTLSIKEMSTLIKGLLLTFVSLSSASIVSVTHDGSGYEIHEGAIVEGWVAKGNFTDAIFDEGFAYLEVETNRDFDDTVQAYAAGIVEGALSYELIYYAYRNTWEGYCDKKGQEFCDRLYAFVDSNMKWLETMIQEKGGQDPIMHQFGLILAQVDGVAEGYNRFAEHFIEDDTILMLNLVGDLVDLELILDPEIRNMTLDEWVESGHMPKEGSCSAIIKLLPDNSDLYVGHAAWNFYETMLRIYKKNIFPFRRTGESGPEDIIPGHTVAFSSYPGLLYSWDDFNLISSGLLSTETTMLNNNPALWQYVQPEGQVMEWMRGIMANRIAIDGESWTRQFSLYNSGTYNNQWMIVDYNLFTPGSSIKPNTLWVSEQMPGYIENEDLSDLLLLQTYFPSYNTPYFENIFNMSGQPAYVEKYGDWFSYDKTARALIFARDHIKVKDIESLLKLMRYNDFKNDPFARCECEPPYTGENGVSARSDLNPANGTYPFSTLARKIHGGIDAKGTNYEMFKNYRILAVSGPTHDDQPIFKWSELEEADIIPHYGHPDEWNFPVVEHEWIW